MPSSTSPCARPPAGGLASISQRQQISLSYLEQLFSRLRRMGLVESTRGPGGGYTLAREPENRSAWQRSWRRWMNRWKTPPDGHGQDASAALWQRLGAVMLQHMATITLASLVQEQIPGREDRSAAGAPGHHPVAGGQAVRVLAPNSVFAFGRSFAAAA
jgi:Rrf2 family iron-sulfur cluster assembly transcriptional regulator